MIYIKNKITVKNLKLNKTNYSFEKWAIGTKKFMKKEVGMADRRRKYL